MASFTIGRLAKAAGVGVETIRFYQRKGLVQVPPRQGAIRRYGNADLDRLRFIRRAQTAGFSLAEIAELLTLDAGQDRTRARELAASRIAALDETIRDLKQARSALGRLAIECSESGAGPCPIIESFVRDGSGVAEGSRVDPTPGARPTSSAGRRRPGE